MSLRELGIMSTQYRGFRASIDLLEAEERVTRKGETSTGVDCRTRQRCILMLILPILSHTLPSLFITRPQISKDRSFGDLDRKDQMGVIDCDACEIGIVN